jgi:membrane fusion protein, multidrug efflux system
LVTANTESGLLTTVTQGNPIWARFALSATEFDALRAATKSAAALKVELLHQDGSKFEQEGVVNFSGSSVDATLGTVQLRAEFPNKQLALLPGEYVRVRLSGGAQAALTVPQTAVLQGPKGPFVWIMNAEGMAEQRVVQTGTWVGEEWRIAQGLNVGEVVVLDNLLKLKPGTPLKPVSVESATPSSSPPQTDQPAPGK